jgi:hypothetical protein
MGKRQALLRGQAVPTPHQSHIDSLVVGARVKRSFPVEGGGKESYMGTIQTARTFDEMKSAHGTRTVCQFEVKFDDYETDPRIYTFTSNDTSIARARGRIATGYRAGRDRAGAHARDRPGERTQAVAHRDD